MTGKEFLIGRNASDLATIFDLLQQVAAKDAEIEMLKEALKKAVARPEKKDE